LSKRLTSSSYSRRRPKEYRDEGTIENLTVAIVGDIAHSRVARFNIWGLTKLGAKVRLVGPQTLMPKDAQQLPVSVYYDLKAGLEGADMVSVLRIQTERQDRGLLPGLREYSRLYGISTSTLRYAKPDVLVLHPGPMNRGVEISAKVADGKCEQHCAVIESLPPPQKNPPATAPSLPSKSMTPTSTSGSDGALPYAGVLLTQDGWLYGVTEEGGQYDKGAVYRLRADGSSFGVVYEFGKRLKPVPSR
jgi:uncharacterized repeat protein (TIGR03803 family)